MKIRHLDMAPSVHPEAYVAPTAVLSGEVRVGRGSCIMHGAVLAAEGGPVGIGANCVNMENAVLRGTQRHPLIMGDHVLAGPHSHLTGCVIADEVFIATGAMVFNGAHLGRASSVPLSAAVHIGCVVPPLTRIPIGWVAVGDPARMDPPGRAEPIPAGLSAAGALHPARRRSPRGMTATCPRPVQARTRSGRPCRALCSYPAPAIHATPQGSWTTRYRCGRRP